MNPVAWIADIELNSLMCARADAKKYNGLVWESPTGSAGIPLYTQPTPVLSKVEHEALEHVEDVVQHFGTETQELSVLCQLVRRLSGSEGGES